MTEQPLVSVLMTAYNREAFIAEAIESVLSSTYRNFELIIVDDGSKDATVEVARKYEKADSRIKVYLNEKNLGDYFNRNKAATYATGKYIKYWDSDDVMYPHCLDVMVRCMEQHPNAGFGLIKPHMRDYPMPYPIFIEKPFEEFVCKQGLFSNAPGSAIISRELFNKLEGFSGKRYIGDFEFWLKISQETSLVIIPAYLGWDRTHPNQERNFDQVEYAKMGINVLMDAFKTSKLQNASLLKSTYLEKRTALSNKILMRDILMLRFSAAKNRYTVNKYLKDKSKV